MKKFSILFLVTMLIGTCTMAQVWESVGSPSSSGPQGIGRLSLGIDYQDNVIVSYYDVSVAKASAQKWDGAAWSYLGGAAGFTYEKAPYNSMTIDQQGVVYFANQLMEFSPSYVTGLSVRKCEDNVWTELPRPTNSIINFNSSAIAPDGTLYVACSESSGKVYKFVDEAWQQVGNAGFCGGTPYYMDMAIGSDGKIYISFNNNGYVHVFYNNLDANATDIWNPLGGEANLAPGMSSEEYNSSLTIDSNNNLFVAYVSNSAGGKKLNAKKWDGEDWSQLGPESFTDGRVQHVSIAIGANDVPYIAASNFEDVDFLRNFAVAYDEASNTWLEVGTGYCSSNEAKFNSLGTDSNGNLFLAYAAGSGQSLKVKKLNLGVIAPQSVEISTEGGVAPEISVDNGTLQLAANVLPENAPQDVEWAIESGNQFATINSDGLVTAITSNAVVTVRATAVNTTVFDTFEVNITNQNSNIPPVSVSVVTQGGVNADIFSLGADLQLLAMVEPVTADQYVTWSIEEGSDVISIDEDGLVTSLSQGYAIVRATNDENPSLFDEIRVNVWENGCTQKKLPNNSGFGFKVNNGFQVAEDFMVEVESRFTVGTVRMRILAFQNIEISSVGLEFLKDDSGQPGEEIISVNDIVPTYQKYLGFIGSKYTYEVQMDLPEPIPFNQGTYWFSPTVQEINDHDVYWDATTLTGGIDGFSLNSDANDGHGWRGTGFTGVFEITGNCTQMPVVIKTLNSVDPVIDNGETLQLEATVYVPGISQDVTWSIASGQEYAAVNSNGLVSGNGVGVATVRATSVDDETLFDEMEVTVLDPDACYQQTFSNSMEDAYLFGGGTRLAVDIDVEEGQTFKISNVGVNTADLATEFSFIFYPDNNGFPGDEIIASVDGMIVHDRVIGFHDVYLYYFHQYNVELDYPVELTPGSYWMEITSNAVGWEATSTSLIGHPLAFKSASTGGHWVYSSVDYEFVYKVDGVCTSVIEQPWTYTVTGQAHTINVPATANPNIFGEPLETGDWVGVFFKDEAGNEVCGGAAEIDDMGSAVVTAYGNDATTPDKDGFAAGERFSWKIFDMSEQIEYPAGATYDASMPNQGNFADFGLSKLTSLEVTFCQSYELSQGWNSISSYITPSDADVELMFAPIVDELTIMRNLTSIYWPGENINTIGDFNNNSGYALKVTEDLDFEICGADFTGKELLLNPGWTYLPVLSECSVDAMELFGNNLNDIVIIQDLIGTQVFWPAMSVYTLETLVPGKAYKMKVANEFTITFPECGSKSLAPAYAQINSATTPWGELNMTPTTQVTAFIGSALEAFENDDMIGAFGPNGDLFGFLKINGQNQNFAITLFGDDLTSIEKDGFAAGETISFKLMRAETGEVIDLVVEYDQFVDNASGTFLTNSVSAVTNVTMLQTGMDQFSESSVQMYPNPARELLNFSVNGVNEQNITVEIYDNKGVAFARESFSNNTVLNISHLAPGVYFVNIRTTELSETRKLVVR
jgi:hypothetical protein